MGAMKHYLPSAWDILRWDKGQWDDRGRTIKKDEIGSAGEGAARLSINNSAFGVTLFGSTP
jgi:hypothetical protein